MLRQTSAELQLRGTAMSASLSELSEVTVEQPVLWMHNQSEDPEQTAGTREDWTRNVDAENNFGTAN